MSVVPPVVPVEPTATTSGDPAADPSKGEVVTYETHRKLLDEKKKIAAKLAELEAAKSVEEQERLRKAGELEKIIEIKDKALQDATAENQQFKKSIEQARKLQAFVKAAGTEVEPKWLNLLDIDSIKLKPDSSTEVDEFSLKAVVDDFKKSWPEAFKTRTASLPPSEMPNGTSGAITESEWKKLSAADMAKHKPGSIKWGE